MQTATDVTLRRVPAEERATLCGFLDSYVRPERRRAGLGARAVAEIWRRYPGLGAARTSPESRRPGVLAKLHRQAGRRRTVAREVREADGRRIPGRAVIGGPSSRLCGESADRDRRQRYTPHTTLTCGSAVRQAC